MANEYLKRTPTSTGSRRSFSISFWMKNSDPTQGYTAIIGAGKVSPSNVYNEIFYNGSQIGLNLDNASDPENYTVTVNRLLRDPSAWMHVLLTFDDSKSVESEKAIFYINGNRVAYTAGASTIVNEGTFFNNADYIQYIGSRAQQDGGTNTFDGQFFDAFMVDGQVLTPDVFGYYKKGDGYISVGTEQATDFKKGQWVPKAPKVIKSVINARGGFGVNGYYLPMNDSTNFGADLHCDPNSIIKLKGEDEPQPYYGAPTTTDAYVSQLREDPYAANLILAVPGIELENTNTELVPNGTFDTDITGWTGYNSTPTWDSVNQRLKIDASTEFDGAETSSGVSVSANTKYTLKLDIHLETAGGVRVQIRDSNNAGGYHPSVDFDTSGTHIVNFDSLSNTSVYIRLMTSGGNTGTAYFDNISIKEAVAVRDYSADIKGSGTNKNLTTNGDAGVALVPSYYGSAMSFDGAAETNLNLGNDSDFDFGTDDFTIEFWRSRNSIVNTESYFTKYDTGETQSFWFGNIGTGKEGFWWYDSSGYGNILSATIAVVGQFDHLCAERHNGTVTLYVNGVSVGSNTSTLPLNVTKHNVKIGANDDTDGSTYYPFNGQIKDLRVYKGVAKYKGGFDVPKPYTPIGIESWRTVDDTTANNFMTMSPLSVKNSSGNGLNLSLSDGNLTTGTDGTANQSARGSFSVSSGKWYFETTLPGATGLTTQNSAVGVAAPNIGGVDGSSGPGYSILYREGGGAFLGNGNSRSDPAAGTHATYVAGDIIGVALDIDNGDVEFFKNGVSAATYNFPAHAVSGTDWTIESLMRQADSVVVHNFGQNPTLCGRFTAGTNADDSGKGLFKYPPPTGFLALCEDNLPTPAIADPGDYFKTVLYTGDGNAGRSITGVGFKPDFVWIKERNSTSSHELFNSVVGPTLKLNSNSTNVESANTNALTSFDSDGFSLGTGGAVNENASRNYVAWCWKAGGAAVSNSDGTIVSQVSANQTAGFSIVSYTGGGSAGTIGHGLGTTPKMIIIKNRGNVTGSTRNWIVYHHDIGATKYLRLNGTNDEATLSTVFNDTEPTSSVFSVGSSVAVSENGDGHIAYCWAEIKGYSKFGSYAGNASADGPLVYCGFKPALVMIKVTTASNSWVIYDSSRNSTNMVNTRLRADLSNIEDTHNGVDFLSNGFKLRDAGSSSTNAVQTYIFAAFAESPFTTANAK